MLFVDQILLICPGHPMVISNFVTCLPHACRKQAFQTFAFTSRAILLIQSLWQLADINVTRETTIICLNDKSASFINLTSACDFDRLTSEIIIRSWPPSLPDKPPIVLAVRHSNTSGIQQRPLA